MREGEGFSLYLIAKTLGITPTEALYLPEIDRYIILIGLEHEMALMSGEEEKVDVKQIDEEKIKKLKEIMKYGK